MQSQGGHSGEANPTCPSEGNRKYFSQIRPEGTNDKNIMRERCASHARRGGWERADFSKIQGLLFSGGLLFLRALFSLHFFSFFGGLLFPGGLFFPGGLSFPIGLLFPYFFSFFGGL